MNSPKAPEAPNYAAAAQAQGAANVEAARTTAKLNNPNITNAYGTQTVTYGGPKVFDEAGYNKALEDAKSGNFQTQKNFDAQAYLAAHPDVAADKKYGPMGASGAWAHYQDWGRPGGWEGEWKAPTRDMFTTDTDPDRVSIDQKLSPEQQVLLDQQNRISQGLGNLAEGGISRVGGMLGTSFDPSVLPGMRSKVDPRFTDAMTGGITRSIDPRFDQTGEQVQEALYRKQSSFLDPQYQQSESDMTTRLANQGIMPGSEAYNREINNFERNKNAAYESARDAAILAGGQEQSRLNEMGLSRAGLNNQAVGQMFGQTLGSNNQNFNQDLSSATFANQARQQALQEQLTLRQLPLNEINALRTGAQVNVPQFQQYTGGGQVQAAPIYGAAQAQGQYDQGLFNADSAKASGNLQAGVGLAAAAAMAF